jgi:hypothetical protein
MGKIIYSEMRGGRASELSIGAALAGGGVSAELAISPTCNFSRLKGNKRK